MILIATTNQILAIVLVVLGGVGAAWKWWMAPRQKRKRNQKAADKLERRLRDIMSKEKADEKLKDILNELNVSHHD